ncbi:unnamed protein product [Ceutorhynchus assimilis]|uniref:Uncharacterized protein n=1 Tax=Ceutorhynchus assimilis TaxID=467358 RepID=A0A9N9MG42_9CUCU|nr:unnamed protein product [Ceutorhynchus assimilis]
MRRPTRDCLCTSRVQYGTADAVSSFHRLPLVQELWVHLKAAKKHTFVPIHEIAAYLGPAKSMGMIGLHAFTGNDNVSSFHSIGKSTALKMMLGYEGSEDAFITLSNGNLEDARPKLINFVIAMYTKSKMYKSLTDCRRALYAKFQRPMENVPPTEDALCQHMRRASYQAQAPVS